MDTCAPLESCRALAPSASLTTTTSIQTAALLCLMLGFPAPPFRSAPDSTALQPGKLGG